MASIEKRTNGKWRARWREYAGGPQKTRNFVRKLDAEQFLDRVRGDLARGFYVDPSAGKVTFHDYAEAWRRAQIHREGTATSVEQQLRLHVYPVLGDRQLHSVRPTEVQAFVRSLEDRLSPATIRVVYGRVAAVFNAAVRDRLIAATPCVDVRRPATEPASTLRVLTTEQVLALATSVPLGYRALIVTGACTGLRPGELFGLALDRVDFLRRLLKVDQELVRSRAGGVEFSALKTPASYRTVPMPDVVSNELAAHLARRPDGTERTCFRERARRTDSAVPVLCDVEASQGAGRGSGVGHSTRSAALLREPSDPLRCLREGHPEPPRPREREDDADTYDHLFPDEEDRTRTAVDAEFAHPAEDQLRTNASE